MAQVVISEAEANARIEPMLEEIPAHVLRAANRDEPIKGRVKASQNRRVPIKADGVTVGFVTPHLGAYGWRLGSIYVLPEYRGRGLAQRAVLSFRWLGLCHFVPNSSPASHAMHKACGFIIWRTTKTGTWYRLPVDAPSDAHSDA